MVADLNDRNSLQPLPQPSQHLLGSQASFHSAGLTSLLLRHLTVGVGGNMTVLQSVPGHSVHFQARLPELTLILLPGPLSS